MIFGGEKRIHCHVISLTFLSWRPSKSLHSLLTVNKLCVRVLCCSLQEETREKEMSLERRIYIRVGRLFSSPLPLLCTSLAVIFLFSFFLFYLKFNPTNENTLTQDVNDFFFVCY